jgi:FKBP-type peptidyl-prolyl cis-trans isomerase FkpA
MNKNYVLRTLLLVAVFTFFLSSCMKDKTDEYEAMELELINDFIADNPDLTFTQKESGLYFFQVQAGTGALAEQHDTAYIIYTGKFLNGIVFDSNASAGRDTLIIPVGEDKTIPGFDESITYMSPGAKAKVLFSSKLGYGPYGDYYGVIFGWTPLYFDIHLVRLVRGSK